jgi:hypothetical protein
MAKFHYKEVIIEANNEKDADDLYLSQYRTKLTASTEADAERQVKVKNAGETTLATLKEIVDADWKPDATMRVSLDKEAADKMVAAINAADTETYVSRTG